LKKLIIKYLSQSISDSELDELRELLSKKKNRKIFEAYIKDEFDLNTLYTKVNTELAYENVWNDMHKKGKVKSLFVKTWYKYAAILVIGLLVSLPFVLNKEEVTPNEEVVVKSSFNIGTDKATLTLEDGTEVVLEKGKTYASEGVTSDGKKVIYKDDVITSELVYNTLTVPRGGQFFVQLSDGTDVWLNSESKLRYPVSFAKGNQRTVELIYGEAYFDVTPASENKRDKFIVHCSSQEVEVLGTEFNIKAYKDEFKVYTTLVEGKVLVKNQIGSNSLVANQQNIMNIVTNQMDVKEVKVRDEIGWIRGEFIFNRKSLDDIMKVLSRWYDMEVIFENDELRKVEFTGTVYKKQNLIEILNLIRNTNYIEGYKIDQSTTILY
jgi:hypothetical protein